VSIPEYHLTMDPADLDWLRAHVGSRRCFPVELRVDGQRWSGWIGYRGRFSRRFPKPSFDLWFPQTARFHGQLELHLSAAYRDPSLLRGRLAHAVFADLDVPTPRAWHAWLTINDRAVGLYTAYESMDQAWLEAHGGTGGTIFYGVGGEGNFGLINPKTGEPKKHLSVGYEKACPDDDDMSALEELLLQVTLPDDTEFTDQIATVLDVDQVLRWLVGIVFTSHTDGLMHNYALVRRTGQRWQLSPWDCDGTFGRAPDGYRVPADYMPLAGVGENYLVLRLLRSRPWRRRYLELWDELLATTLTLANVEKHLHPIAREIRATAQADGNKAFSNTTFLREPAAIRAWVRVRTAFLRAQVAEWWREFGR
jgi:spore coat protein H